MESSSANVTFDNITNFNRTLTHHGFVSHCYDLYEYSRIVYIPLFHALVMVAGLVANLYMIIALHCARSKTSARRKALSDVDFFFLHLGVCDIVTLLTVPMWVTQMILARGWVFGNMLCKLVKGLITFCFQYGICLMVYINIERYMKVVHNRTTLECMTEKPRLFRRTIASLLCACVPVISALVDICYYNVRPISRNSVMCFNNMPVELKFSTFWVRMAIFIILPIIILVYCNGMIAHSVRTHMNRMSYASRQHKMRRVQILTFLTVMFFTCCWIPLIVSTIYYRSHIGCEEVKYVVLNVCIAIGNVHCITSPVLYICMKTFRRHTVDSFSLPKDGRQSFQMNGGSSIPIKSNWSWAVMRKCSTSSTSE